MTSIRSSVGIIGLIAILLALPWRGGTGRAEALTFQQRGRVAAPASRADSIARALEAYEVRDFLASVGERFMEMVDAFAPDSLPETERERIRTAGRTHLADSVLLGDMLGILERSLDSAQLRDLYGWLFSPSLVAFRDEVRSYAPPESPEEYARRLQRIPPAQSRVEAVARLAEAQAAGEFRAVAEEAIEEAARGALITVGADVPPYEPPTEREIFVRAEQYVLGGTVERLQRFHEVGTSRLAEVAGAYDSPSGKWFVGAYTEALYRAVQEASVRLTGELRG